MPTPTGWWKEEWKGFISSLPMDNRTYESIINDEQLLWIESLIYRIEQEAIKTEMSRITEQLAYWIDGNVGASSEAIYLYMTIGRIPPPFDAPSDSDDRERCVKLLQAIPEWIPRLSEIEKLKIEESQNGVKITPWNEQIPHIRADIASAIEKINSIKE